MSYTPPSGRQQGYRIGTVGNLTAAQEGDIGEELAGHVAHGIDIHAQKKATRIEAGMSASITWFFRVQVPPLGLSRAQDRQ